MSDALDRELRRQRERDYQRWCLSSGKDPEATETMIEYEDHMARVYGLEREPSR